MMNKKSESEYNSSSIEVLKGLEAVRKIPSMYIGSVSGEGYHHLLWEIIDNSIDEVLAGYCNKITVKLLPENYVEIIDNGRGIPVGIHTKTNKSTLETILTTLHSGGKFNSNSYFISGGLHGVGTSVVNALSSSFQGVVYRNNQEHKITFINGGLKQGEITVRDYDHENGTKVIFKPDSTIFGDKLKFDFITIKTRLEQLAFLNKGLEINLIDARENDKDYKIIKYIYKNGIKAYVNNLVQGESKKISETYYIEVEDHNNSIIGEISLAYTNSYQDKLFSFCNNINTKEGGTHEDGFKAGLIKAINNYQIYKNFNKKNDHLNWDDLKEGLIAIVSIKHTKPEFRGQTKTKLGNSDARTFVYQTVKEYIYKFLLENPISAKKILDKVLLTHKGRVAAVKAKEATIRKGLLEKSFNLPGKLADCQSQDSTKTELFLVEGDSAGGSAKLGRDRVFQAILPLKGKILNVEKSNTSSIFKNNEISAIFSAVGVEPHKTINLEQLRYQKIIIMTDADVDGSHITILLLTLFYRFFKSLIINGNIFIACPPLYKIIAKKKGTYLYNEAELSEQIASLESNKTPYRIQRFKGLGEMNPEQLWETTMDPKNRIIKQITINDALEAEAVLVDLMGDDIANRRAYIIENADFNQHFLNN